LKKRIAELKLMLGPSDFDIQTPELMTEIAYFLYQRANAEDRERVESLFISKKFQRDRFWRILNKVATKHDDPAVLQHIKQRPRWLSLEEICNVYNCETKCYQIGDSVMKYAMENGVDPNLIIADFEPKPMYLQFLGEEGFKLDEIKQKFQYLLPYVKYLDINPEYVDNWGVVDLIIDDTQTSLGWPLGYRTVAENGTPLIFKEAEILLFKLILFGHNARAFLLSDEFECETEFGELQIYHDLRGIFERARTHEVLCIDAVSKNFQSPCSEVIMEYFQNDYNLWPHSWR